MSQGASLFHPSRPIQLVIPMSGQGTRFQAAGFNEPKPLIPINGIPIIERLLSSFPTEWPCVFILAENHLNTGLPETLKKLRPNCTITTVKPHTRGPGFALWESREKIDLSLPTLVSYCDYGMAWDANHFAQFVDYSDCDACVISYRGFHPHYLNPLTYAYCRMDGDRVAQIKEKGSFTDNRENEFASNGAYYFKSGKLLMEALEYQIREKIELNGELYTSLTIQALIELKKDTGNVRVYEIPYFFQWGTPSDLYDFEYWEKTYISKIKFSNAPLQCEQLLMPMAGLGSRFESLTPVRKPLITIDGQNMFRAAQDSLPTAGKSVFVTLNELSSVLGVKKESPQEAWVSLEKTPEGQALSTLAGVSQLNPSKSVIVSSCDHAVVIDPKKWLEFQNSPDCDAAIFTVRGFPNVRYAPEKFAYVVAEDQKEKFPKVQSVSVKKPISSDPSRDHLLVGTFWFKDAALLKAGIEKLVSLDKRVNGELYLDSIFDILMNEKKTVRVFPLDGYINWGDPQSLAVATYWSEVFSGHKPYARKALPSLA